MQSRAKATSSSKGPASAPNQKKDAAETQTAKGQVNDKKESKESKDFKESKDTKESSKEADNKSNDESKEDKAKAAPQKPGDTREELSSIQSTDGKKPTTAPGVTGSDGGSQILPDPAGTSPAEQAMTEVAAPPLASEVELQGNPSAISTIAQNPSSESTRTNSQRMWVISDFEIGRPLGKGHFGFIFLARYKPKRVVVALKVLSKDHISKHNVKHQVKREIQIHYRLRHPNILRLKNYFHDERRVYIILECANGGDLYSRLKKKGRLEEPEAARYVRQLADALSYCHAEGVIHRGMKPENILLDGKGNVKIADFGWSVVSCHSRRETICGILDYLPPEMIYGHTHDHTVDNWAVGILLYELLVGRPPFEFPDQGRTVHAIVNCRFAIPPIVKEGPSDLMRKLIVKEPCMRLSLAAVLAHPWVVSMSKNSATHANQQTLMNNPSTTTQGNQNSTE